MSAAYEEARSKYFARLLADWPPLTEEQAAVIRRVFGINQPTVDE